MNPIGRNAKKKTFVQKAKPQNHGMSSPMAPLSPHLQSERGACRRAVDVDAGLRALRRSQPVTRLCSNAVPPTLPTLGPAYRRGFFPGSVARQTESEASWWHCKGTWGAGPGPNALHRTLLTRPAPPLPRRCRSGRRCWSGRRCRRGAALSCRLIHWIAGCTGPVAHGPGHRAQNSYHSERNKEPRHES
jgi:hypothetical protein